MNADMLTQFLIDVTRGRLRDAYAAAPSSSIDGAPLSETQRVLVRAVDIGGLYTAGANPLVLLTFARTHGWTMERYYAVVAEATPPHAEEGMPA
jgi:hypothetical protein